MLGWEEVSWWMEVREVREETKNGMEGRGGEREVPAVYVVCDVHVQGLLRGCVEVACIGEKRLTRTIMRSLTRKPIENSTLHVTG